MNSSSEILRPIQKVFFDLNYLILLKTDKYLTLVDDKLCYKNELVDESSVQFIVEDLKKENLLELCVHFPNGTSYSV